MQCRCTVANSGCLRMVIWCHFLSAVKAATGVSSSLLTQPTSTRGSGLAHKSRYTARMHIYVQTHWKLLKCRHKKSCLTVHFIVWNGWSFAFYSQGDTNSTLFTLGASLVGSSWQAQTFLLSRQDEGVTLPLLLLVGHDPKIDSIHCMGVAYKFTGWQQIHTVVRQSQS